MEHWTLAELRAAISLDLTFAHEDTAYLQHQRSLCAVFDYSWRWLTAHEQIVLSQLSVFRGTLGRTAALAITDVSLNDLSADWGKRIDRRVIPLVLAG